MAKKRYTKAEEEILQILNDADHEPVWRRVHMPRRSPGKPPRAPRHLPFDSSWLWIIVSFGLALLAILVGDWSETLAVLFAILSVLAFLSPIVLNRRPAGMGQTARQWRGRDIDLPPSRSGIIGEMRYRLWQMRNRR